MIVKEYPSKEDPGHLESCNGPEQRTKFIFFKFPLATLGNCLIQAYNVINSRHTGHVGHAGHAGLTG